MTVTDIYTHHTTTIDPADFTAVVTPWFPHPDTTTADSIAAVQHDLDTHRFIPGSAITSLGLVIEAA